MGIFLILLIAVPVAVVVTFFEANFFAPNLDREHPNDNREQPFVVKAETEGSGGEATGKDLGVATVRVTGTTGVAFNAFAGAITDSAMMFDDRETVRGTVPAQFGVEYENGYWSNDGVSLHLERGFSESEDSRVVVEVSDTDDQLRARKVLESGEPHINMEVILSHFMDSGNGSERAGSRGDDGESGNAGKSLPGYEVVSVDGPPSPVRDEAGRRVPAKLLVVHTEATSEEAFRKIAEDIRDTSYSEQDILGLTIGNAYKKSREKDGFVIIVRDGRAARAMSLSGEEFKDGGIAVNPEVPEP